VDVVVFVPIPGGSSLFFDVSLLLITVVAPLAYVRICRLEDAAQLREEASDVKLRTTLMFCFSRPVRFGRLGSGLSRPAASSRPFLINVDPDGGVVTFIRGCVRCWHSLPWLGFVPSVCLLIHGLGKHCQWWHRRRGASRLCGSTSVSPTNNNRELVAGKRTGPISGAVRCRHENRESTYHAFSTRQQKCQKPLGYSYRLLRD
jgi:hypothetical protein